MITISKPKVSVVMPVYNAKKFINRAIDSILQQSFQDYELILIVDCPTDGTEHLLSDYHDKRIRIIRNESNQGIAYSRNLGIECCEGEFIALMDDDDIAPKNRLAKEIDFLEENPLIGAVGGRHNIIDENDNLIGVVPEALRNPKFIKASLMFYNPIANGSMMFRKEIVQKANILFQDNCLGMEDYLFWTDFSCAGHISNIEDIMLQWRRIKGNHTLSVVEEKKNERKMKFSGIQLHAMQANGIMLSSDDCDFFCRMFPENLGEVIVNEGEVKRTYTVLKRIVDQAKEKQLSNALEIEKACKKQFSRRMDLSNMW